MQVLTGGGMAGMQATCPPVAGTEDFQKTLIPLSEKRPKNVYAPCLAIPPNADRWTAKAAHLLGVGLFYTSLDNHHSDSIAARFV